MERIICAYCMLYMALLIHLLIVANIGTGVVETCAGPTEMEVSVKCPTPLSCFVGQRFRVPTF